jgi:hypothetical protein
MKPLLSPCNPTRAVQVLTVFPDVPLDRFSACASVSNERPDAAKAVPFSGQVFDKLSYFQNMLQSAAGDCLPW